VYRHDPDAVAPRSPALAVENHRSDKPGFVGDARRVVSAAPNSGNGPNRACRGRLVIGKIASRPLLALCAKRAWVCNGLRKLGRFAKTEAVCKTGADARNFD
jgi:hypothetical protein